MLDETSRELTAFASILGLAGFVLLVVAVASTGAMFKPGAWYEALAKPLWTPPNWLFPVAWTILYLMIAVAGWLVWREAGLAGAGPALTLYFLQLILNAARGLVMVVLWPAPNGSGDDRHRGTMACRRGDHRRFLRGQSSGGTSSRTLPRLGQLRRGTQFRYLAGEQLTRISHQGRRFQGTLFFGRIHRLQFLQC